MQYWDDVEKQGEVSTTPRERPACCEWRWRRSAGCTVGQLGRGRNAVPHEGCNNFFSSNRLGAACHRDRDLVAKRRAECSGGSRPVRAVAKWGYEHQTFPRPANHGASLPARIPTGRSRWPRRNAAQLIYRRGQVHVCPGRGEVHLGSAFASTI